MSLKYALSEYVRWTNDEIFIRSKSQAHLEFTDLQNSTAADAFIIISRTIINLLLHKDPMSLLFKLSRNILYYTIKNDLNFDFV